MSFTDDAGNDETVTRPGVYAHPPQPLYGGLRDGPDSHDGSDAFTVELYFTENIAIGYEALRDHVLGVLGVTRLEAQARAECEQQARLESPSRT